VRCYEWPGKSPLPTDLICATIPQGLRNGGVAEIRGLGRVAAKGPQQKKQQGSHTIPSPSCDCSLAIRLSATGQALFLPSRTGGETAHRFTARVRQPNDCCPRKRHVGGTKAKPLAAYRRRLCCLSKRCAQYKISKSKYAVSIMAVTLATESTKASRASL
jgi:hypothetical protein